MSDIGKLEKDVSAKEHQSRENMASRPIWEIIDEIMLTVPEEVLNSLPTDGAERHDHYLYGKREKAQ